MPSDEKNIPDDDGDERIAAELKSDIRQLAKQVEKRSGRGQAAVAMSARSVDSLADLAMIRDDLMNDLAKLKEKQKEKRDWAWTVLAVVLSIMMMPIAMGAGELLDKIAKWLLG